MMEKLEEMFEDQVVLTQQFSITNLMNCQQKFGALVENYMLVLIRSFAEVKDNGVELDTNIQIEMAFKSLSKDFADFTIAYKLGNNQLALTQLMRELQSYKLMLNDSDLV
ncbi:hypothetical protein PVK06_042316 [Gossypium arboreum]|uniref:Uncharacterized protein n=1 Tax=Gossypium arboreum TaxID=29729 RepID=A0ABR0MKV3_GOSAR|nr:hypothetical protein PVK06_042316 [Gossypium arboreum]